MTCGETCSTSGCHGGIGCAAHRTHYDHLGERMKQEHSKDTHLSGLLGAFGFAACIAIPFALYFWSL
jgi:hypothetical protein